jgi:hypothetical protein
MGKTKIHQCDIATALRTDRYLAAASLAALERQRGWHAEAELDGLLKAYGVSPTAVAAHVSMLRRSIGARLVRAGQRLAGASHGGGSPDTAPAAGVLHTTG